MSAPIMKDILSFARRIGRKLKDSQNDMIEHFIPELNRNTGAFFDQNGKFVFPEKKYKSNYLEIGFGNGEHLYGRAKRDQESLFIGCEPYLNGVASLLGKIKEEKLKNIFIWHDDANILLNLLPDKSLDGIYILFADPWPKKKHHKRRIINQKFLSLLAKKIKVGGDLFIATDHVEFAKWSLNHLLLSDHFMHEAHNASDWYKFPDDWIKTKYQRKAETIGIKSSYFHFKVI